MGRALAAWLMVAGALAATPMSPRDVVESAVTRVVMALQQANLDRPEPEQAGRLYVDRQGADIKRIAAELFDFQEMARRTLSRHWAARTPRERAEFVRLFTGLLERTYIGKIESYAGEKIVYVGEVIDGSYATVHSKVISTRRRSETTVDYRLYFNDGHWRVYDMLIDGVSFVSTYRSEFARVIQLSSYEALIDTLRKRVVEAAAIDAGRAGSASPRTTR